RPPARMAWRFSGLRMAPPPVATTWPCSRHSSASTHCSRSRKPCSPSTSNIHGMFAPVRCSISLSESLKASRNSLANNRPMVLFPAPIGPTMIRFCTTLTTHCYRLVVHDTRSNEDQQLGFLVLHDVAAEQAAEERQVAQEGHFFHTLGLGVGEHTTDNDGFTIRHQDLGIHLVLVDRRHAIEGIGEVRRILG